jgi:cell wall-associated NlpC family hydrolase
LHKAIVEYEDLLGAPFKYGGTSYTDGFDCWTLTKELYRRTGIELPHYSSNKSMEVNDANIKDAKQYYKEIQVPDPICIVTFMLRYPYVSHMGVMLDRLRFIHILKRSSVSVERIDSILWHNRIKGFFKYATN